ncbi:MAG: efflux RND transporter permease subunit [Pirellulales bacterium]|nr:efflux RND transporter permease subunit [Pirellulales bacterium]
MLLSDYSIDNPVKVAVGVVLVGLFGALAFVQIPVQLTPEVVKPTVAVMTFWPGSSPGEVETEIIAKQEEQLQDVEGMIDFRSTSGYGFGEIEMEFAVGTDLNATLLKVNNKLSQVREKPEDADEPIIRSVSANSSSIAYINLVPAPPSHAQLQALVREHPELADPVAPLLAQQVVDVPTVYRLARTYPAVRELLKNDPRVNSLRTFAEDELAARVERVEGVGECEVYGGSEQELRVIFNPVKLAAHRITLGELRAALARENTNVSAGDLWESRRSYVIRTLGQFASGDEVGSVIVAQRDGAPVYVRDLARVELSSKKTLGVGHQRGVDMLTLAVKRQQGANVIRVMEGVRAAVDELNAGLLASRGLYLMLSYDETVYINSAIGLVTGNFWVGGLLSVSILLVVLRNWRATLVISLAIPICAIATFLVIRMLGRSINVVSLAGMAFAVGMVVDNAIVVLENIFSRYQNGERPRVAASRGTSEVWGAVLASTATTVAVFLPVIFIQEEAGQLFRDISIAIAAGVALSLVVSLTVVPSATRWLLADKRVPTARPAAVSKATWYGRLIDRCGSAGNAAILRIASQLTTGHLGWFGSVLFAAMFGLGVWGCLPRTRTLPGAEPPFPPVAWPWIAAAVVAVGIFVAMLRAWPRLSIAISTFVLCGGVTLMLLPDAEYLPEGNKNLVFASLSPPPGYNVDQLLALGQTVESRLEPYWEAKPGTPEAARLTDGPLIDNFFLVARGGRIFMGARAVVPEQAKDLVPLLQRATQGLPGVMSFVSQASLFERNLATGRTIDIEITGPKLEQLVDLGRKVMLGVQEIYPVTTETSVQPIPSLDLGTSELHIRRHPEKAAQYGVSTTELGYAIDALNDGAFAGTYWHNGKEIDLVLYGDAEYSRRTQDIAALPLAAPNGQLVRVGDVADVRLQPGAESILRIDRQKAITIQVRPGSSIPLETAMRRIQAEVVDPLVDSPEAQGGLYRFRLAGTADDLRQVRGILWWRIGLAVFITFLLIAALYESFLYPWVIMVSVPLAAVGGVVSLWLLNQFVVVKLDVITMLGFVILTGTVVNNAILLVERALQLIRYENWDYREAALEGVRSRIRPIFLTAGTTVLGLVPLVVSPGAGSELYRGLGCIVLGGLSVSTLFTFFLVPVLFCLAYEFRVRWIGPERPAAAEDYEPLAVPHVALGAPGELAGALRSPVIE